MLWKALLGALALSLMAVAYQTHQVTRLTVAVAQRDAQIASMDQNLADILKDRANDSKIDNASPDDLFRDACISGFLQHPDCP